MTSPIESSTPTGLGVPYLGVSSPNPGNNWYRRRSPTARDFTNYQVLDRWSDLAARDIWLLEAKQGGSANWVRIVMNGNGPIHTLTGDSGGPIVPVAGNITIAGGANITTVGTTGTITVNLDTTLTGLTSVSSVTFVTSSATLGVTYTANSITATGSNADIPINLVPKGTGAVAVTGALTASTTITAGTGITSTLGNIVASAGNIVATLGSVSAGTTVTAGTSITATLGNITATDGNVVINGAGRFLSVHGGAVTDFAGSAVLVGGTVSVANTNIAANDLILLSRSTTGGTEGTLSYVISAGASFTITSSSGTDTSTIAYVIVRQTA